LWFAVGVIFFAQKKVVLRVEKDQKSPPWSNNMRASYVVHLPLELQHMISRIVLDEKHLLARQLFKCLCRRLHRMDRPTASDLEFATLYWTAIARIGCYDNVIVRGVRRHHDKWYQELQDPYGMHRHVMHIFIKFHQDLQPIMYGVAIQDELTKRASSIPSAS
tara:strand:+ start:409 stop:897 length:489 start_codon:yes stop_codon:yes gene_type:complete